MKTIILPAPAKLNLFLKVINKRPDGYHNLKTLFERIDLQDELTFSRQDSGRITIRCDHPQVPIGPKNLVYKVAQLLKNEYGIKDGVHVQIRKKIPVAAGLAGGSSNAATTLLGLNRLWQLNLPQAKLIDCARQVGSDVAFFLYEASWALGEDRGDAITPLSIPAKIWHVLVVPKIKMYSREVFTRLNLGLTKKGDDVNILIRSLKMDNILKAKSLLRNDLASSILAICPRLQNVKDRLTRGGLAGVSFSGSGPAVFALTDDKEQAWEFVRVLRRQYRQVYAVCTF